MRLDDISVTPQRLKGGYRNFVLILPLVSLDMIYGWENRWPPVLRKNGTHHGPKDTFCSFSCPSCSNFIFKPSLIWSIASKFDPKLLFFCESWWRVGGGWLQFSSCQFFCIEDCRCPSQSPLQEAPITTVTWMMMMWMMSRMWIMSKISNKNQQYCLPKNTWLTTFWNLWQRRLCHRQHNDGWNDNYGKNNTNLPRHFLPFPPFPFWPKGTNFRSRILIKTFWLGGKVMHLM